MVSSFTVGPVRFSGGGTAVSLDGAEFITYFSKPISRLLANNSPRETALVTVVGHMPNTFDTATIVMPSTRTDQ